MDTVVGLVFLLILAGVTVAVLASNISDAMRTAYSRALTARSS